MSRLTNTLRTVLQTFPDKHHLHTRVHLALDKTNVRVAVIPFQCRRTDINGVLDASLADPLASDQSWYQQFRHRLLAKDCLVKYSPSFDHVLTHNSLVEFPVPIRHNVEILEANSWKDSFDHIKMCHFHIFVSNNTQKALTTPLPSSAYPSTLVLDLPTVDESNSNLHHTVISAQTAQRGVSLFAESPRNVTEYQNLYNQSNLHRFEELLDAETIEQQFLQSIVETCEQVATPCPTDIVNNEHGEISNLRKEWAKQAHQELQTTLSNGLTQWSRSFGWYKLYYKVDDIYDSIAMTLPRIYLTDAQHQLDYVNGRIDSFASRHFAVQTLDPSNTIAKSYQQILATNAVQLHNDGLNSLATYLFGLQLPMTVVPLLGVYFYDYSWYSMGAVIGLGLVVGARRLQKAWSKAFNKFKLNVLDQARQALGECEAGIWQRWESKIVQQQDSIRAKQAVVEKLKHDVLKDY